MADKCKRFCSVAGCPVLIEKGLYCDAHKGRQSDYYTTLHSRYCTKEWQRVRREKLRKTGYCEVCKSDKRLVVHHVLPVDMGGTDTIENLQTLCRDCHEKVHHRK